MALTPTFTVEDTMIHWGARAGKRHRRVKIAIPGGETYGTGLALDKAKMGCPTVLESVTVIGGDAPVAAWVWDRDAAVLRLFETGAALSGFLAEAAAGDTPAAQDILVEAIGW